MALTKLDYLRIAERVEATYMNCSTQLILNIVRHLASGKGLSTAEWQIKKLSEMQSLTRESMEIIAANTGKRREAVEQAFREVFGIGLADTEKELQAAVKAGKLMPVPSVEESEAMRQLLQAYIGQADDALNLVNTVMLDSTLSRYRYYVNQIDTESQKKAAEILAKLGATDEAGLGTNLAYTQNVLNTQSTGVVTGAVARQKAVRDAIKDLASKGITGFVDAGGHHWTPEAYVNMDIRTTAHNVAIEAQKQRSAEYGVSTFQISTHAGARPLCAPYQGWICSWDNGGGTVTDLYGKEYQVHGINETSYGEAAGIFGINCGHFPETFVDGYSIPRYEELTPEQEKQNEIEYAQSQQQRELEREIRQAKTEAAAYSAAGDKAEFQKAAAKVKEKQTDYKQFCEQTGRTPRPDRTQVSTYSRSEASKVSWSNRKNPTEPKPPRDFTLKPKKEKVQIPPFTPAKTRQEAEEYAKRFAKLVNYDRISVDKLNRINEELNTLTAKYPIEQLGEITNRSSGIMSANFHSLKISPTKLGKTLDESAFNFEFNQRWYEAELRNIRAKYPNKIPTDVQSRIDQIEKKLKFTRWGVCDSQEDKIKATVIHEYGHILSDQYVGMINGERANPHIGTNWSIRGWTDKWKQLYEESLNNGDIYKISAYGATKPSEFFAESFAMYELGEPLPTPIKSLLEEIIKNGIL